MDLCENCFLGRDTVFSSFYKEQTEVIVYVLESLRLYGIKTERVEGTDDLLVRHGKYAIANTP